MGAFGIVKGLAKMAGGAITGDGEMFFGGLKKTAVNTVTTTVQVFTKEVVEKAFTDDDED